MAKSQSKGNAQRGPKVEQEKPKPGPQAKTKPSEKPKPKPTAQPKSTKTFKVKNVSKYRHYDHVDKIMIDPGDEAAVTDSPFIQAQIKARNFVKV